MTIKPLYDRVLVERLEVEQKSSGGIIIPDSAKEKPQKGKVIATGGGEVMQSGNVRSLSVKVGDVVLFAKWSGTEIKEDGKEFLIMKESDILAVIE